MAKRKSSGIKLTVPLFIFIIIIALAIAGFLGFSYFKTTKAMECEIKLISYSLDGNKANVVINVTGEADSYDVRFVDNNGESVVAIENSTRFNEDVVYDVTLSYDTTYDILVDVRMALMYVKLFDVTHSDTVENIVVPKKNVTPGEDGITEGVMYDGFQIHFMTLGNDAAGDSIYIKAGDNDILIDAGSDKSSYNTTHAYIDNYCTDKKLEYVIATHGDADHISAFPKMMEYYDTGIIITNEKTVKTTTTYQNMLDAFSDEVTNGAKWYYAADCYNNINGAQREYVLSDNVVMKVLYNYYYFNKASDENDHSVCLMFTYTSGSDTKYFMLTGDLEKSGETKMAEYYDGSTPEKTLPKVDLFKAGHHGSKTSSNDVLLDIIQPKMCVVSCCCGTNEYTNITENQFPTQDFIDRISKWTDRVYITTTYETFDIKTNTGSSSSKGVASGGQYIDTDGYVDMNGNICVSAGLNSSSELGVGVWCSNCYTWLKDSDWMNLKVVIDGVERNVRTMPENWQ